MPAFFGGQEEVKLPNPALISQLNVVNARHAAAAAARKTPSWAKER